jgi:two-component system chemotaxis response regulator CheB
MEPRRVRALVVDDSALARAYLTRLLDADPEIEVVGTAPDGRAALDRIDELDPNVVVLDVEMPVMDGLEALRRLKRDRPDRRVVMFSSYTTEGARTTVEALALGAEDFVAKPSSLLTATDARQEAGAELIRKVKALAPDRRAATGATTAPTLASPGAAARVDVVAIAASTGGPNLLNELFRRFPEDLPVPVLVVQHMPAMFTGPMAERLDKSSPLKVVEARGGEVLRPGVAWVAPGGFHMAVRRRLGDVTVELNQDPPENSVRPAADVLFRSVEQCYRDKALAIVLTGMGRDGLEGARRLHAAGSTILAQDRESSVVWGMPGAVAGAGIAEAILTPDQISEEIVRRARAGRAP